MGVEVKSSIILIILLLLKFYRDSIIGNVNFEAGSITANHFNERKDKEIFKINEKLSILKIPKMFWYFFKIGAMQF